MSKREMGPRRSAAARPPLVVPPDLRRALDADPARRASFDALSYTHRREHVDALLEAKKPETRERRLLRTLDMLDAGRGAHATSNSARPVLDKLQVRAGERVLVVGADAATRRSLTGSAAGITLVSRGQGDVVLLFAATARDLADRIPKVDAAARAARAFWIAFPKGSSGRATTLTRDTGWGPAVRAGWQGVSLVSIDDTWSAVRHRQGN